MLVCAREALLTVLNYFKLHSIVTCIKNQHLDHHVHILLQTQTDITF